MIDRSTSPALFFIPLVLAIVLGAQGPRVGPDCSSTELRGLRPGDRFGAAVVAAGDVDGDGRGDWLVGAPSWGAALPLAGRASLCSGVDGRVLWAIEGDGVGARLGSAVAAVGDLDGAGVTDFQVGEPRGVPAAGRALLLSGRDGSLLRSWRGETPGEEFGRALAGVGDVDGDGLPDLAVGAPLADGGGTNGGRLDLFSGADGRRIRSWTGEAWDQLGRAVVGLGDLDGDGQGEIAVGVPFDDGGAFNGGAVRVLRGADGGLLYERLGTGIGDQLGFALAGGLDVDLDGCGDLLVASPGADGAGIDAGSAALFSGVDGVELLRLDGGAAGDGLSAVALVPDLSGDGRAELLVGASGADGGGPEAGEVRLHSGADGSLLGTFLGAAPRAWLGASLAAAPPGSDSAATFAAGAPVHDDEGARAGSLRLFHCAAGSSGSTR